MAKKRDGIFRYARVNKKALEQYVSFSEQRDALIGRKGEQDSADKSIQDLIDVLDGQKDEAIERTFKQVSKYVQYIYLFIADSDQVSSESVTVELAGDGRPAPADHPGGCCGLLSWSPLGR